MVATHLRRRLRRRRRHRCRRGRHRKAEVQDVGEVPLDALGVRAIVASIHVSDASRRLVVGESIRSEVREGRVKGACLLLGPVVNFREWWRGE